jgi:antitoxin-like ribbon-helix-helix protein
MTKARAKLGSSGTGIFAAEPEPTPAPPVRKPAPPKLATTEIATAARPDREGRKSMPFWTTEAAKKQLRVLAAELDTSQQDLMTEALNMMFQKHGKPPIA